ncbi:MAG TPA: DNA ligase [Pirellulaceae bacterium]|nr:DNA ligase [Pirellulaceae bacterium]
MPDLADGESIEVQGSSGAKYVLKNSGGVYSCTCPAWRNQSVGIERRTCKHLRKLRGDQAEQDRVGSALPTRPAKKEGEATEPPLLLAHTWDNYLDLSGWWMSEKLDGVRAYWDGKQLLSRQGNLLHAPDWFLESLPEVPLDGELWLGRKSFQKTVSIVRRQDKSDHWKQISFLVFDAPAMAEPFERRVEFLTDAFAKQQHHHAKLHPHELCRDLEHLKQELARVESLGGEGLMLRQPGSKYETGRSFTLLKIKTFHDAEARVVEHIAGAGRHEGRLGALGVELPDGTRFSVGTGFSDAQRENPPPIGSTITFRYQELSDRGVPRFPSFVRLRSDAVAGAESAKPRPANERDPGRGVASSATATSSKAARRYFEFVEGKSSKFWEISQAGREVTVRYGRIGTDGQTQTKSFADEAAAQRHAEKLIGEKIEKGYAEK